MPVYDGFKKAEDYAEALEITNELKTAQFLKESREKDATLALDKAAQSKEMAGLELAKELQVLEQCKTEIESQAAEELSTAKLLGEREEFAARAALIEAEALKTDEQTTFVSSCQERLLEKKQQLDKLQLEITELNKKKNEIELAITSIREFDIEFINMSSLMEKPPTDWMDFFNEISNILENAEKKSQKHIPFKLFDRSPLLTPKGPIRQEKITPNFNQPLSPKFNLLLELLDLGHDSKNWGAFRKQQETFSLNINSFNKEYKTKYEQLEHAIKNKKKHVESRKKLQGQKDQLQADLNQITADLTEKEPLARMRKIEILTFETRIKKEEDEFFRVAQAKNESIDRRIQAAQLKIQEVKKTSEHRIAAIKNNAQTTQEKLIDSIEMIKRQLKKVIDDASQQFEETKNAILKMTEQNAVNAVETLAMQNARRQRIRQILANEKDVRLTQEMQERVEFQTIMAQSKAELRDLKMKMELNALSVDEQQQRQVQEKLQQGELSELLTAMYDDERRLLNLKHISESIAKEFEDRQTLNTSEQDEFNELLAVAQTDEQRLIGLKQLNDLITAETLKRQTLTDFEQAEHNTLTAQLEQTDPKTLITAAADLDRDALQDNATRKKKAEETEKLVALKASPKFNEMFNRLATQINNMEQYGDALILGNNDADGMAVRDLAQNLNAVLNEFNSKRGKPISLDEFNQFKEKLRTPLLNAYDRMGNHHAKWKQHILNILLALTIFVSYLARAWHTKRTIGHSEFFFSKTNRQVRIEKIQHSLNDMDKEVLSEVDPKAP